MKVELSKATVTLKDKLTWGEVEDISEVLYKGAKIGKEGMKDFDASVLRESKYRLLEIAVVNIKENGEKKEFTRDWMNGLSPDDGEKLLAEADKLKEGKA